MLRFARKCEEIAATSKKSEKTSLVSNYLQSLPLDYAATAAIFLAGHPFAAHDQRTLQVGGSLLWRVIGELSGKSDAELTEIYRRHGDAGSVAADALPQMPESSLPVTAVQEAFSAIAEARGPAAKTDLLRNLLHAVSPLEAKYIIKIMSGDLRIGLKESLVEEAMAQAFDEPLNLVKRANMLVGDIGETLRLASTARLADAHLRLFHPIDFMLASPVESSEEAVSYFDNAAVEDKYDGIRAQAHVSRGQVRLFSRTRDEITESFPELLLLLAGLPQATVLDGEIVAWKMSAAAAPTPADVPLGAPDMHSPTVTFGRALPFSTLQQRLGRKKVTNKMMRDVPVAYLLFDILYCDGDLLLDRPLRERAQILDRLLAEPRISSVRLGQPQPSLDFGDPHEDCFGAILRSHMSPPHSPQDVESLFTAARAHGNEGLMIKDLDSPYTPGRRGKSWLKMKRELATLDVVVTAVEYGHGKRVGVLSDYTFAVWNGEQLVNIGKAYSGLTDAEIAEMTEWFLVHKTIDQGLRLEVEPKIVLEVAFNNVMRSSRHESGYALRFPRIVRLRPDKRPEDADTIQRVQEVYHRQER